MKKRKVLFLLPVAALVLSGCTIQEGWETVSKFFTDSVYEPVKNWVEDLLGIKHEEKKEEKKDDQGGQEGGGDHGGEGGGEQGEVSKYGDAQHPLTVSEAVALIDSETPTEEIMFVVGEVKSNEAWSTQYSNTSIVLTDGQKDLKVFRTADFPEGYDYEKMTQNCMKGQTVVASGIGDLYNGTYELTQNPAVLSITGEGPQHVDIDNYGTEQNPLSVSEAIAVIDLQDPTDQDLYVVGTVTTNSAWSSDYNNIDITISDGQKELTLFRANKFPEGYAYSSLKKDDLKGKVVVGKGIGTLYNGTKYELNQGCSVVSIETPVIAVTGVEVTPETLQLEVGQQYQLTAKVLPENASNQEITWSSSADAKAEVTQAGVITAKAPGEVDITCTTSDGGFTDKCTLTVVEATKELTKIQINGNPKTEYTVGDNYSKEGLTVAAIYSDQSEEDITPLVTWAISKEKAEAGDTEIKITATYGEFSSEITVAVTVIQKSGIQIAYEAGLALEPGDYTSESYTFSGVCTAVTGNSFFIQDGDYAMYVYNKPTTGIAVGKVVEVTATIQNYSGLVETKSVSASAVTGDGVVPAALNVTKMDDIGNANILADVASATFKSKDKAWSSSQASLVVFTIGGDDITVKFDKFAYNDDKGQLLNDATAGDVFALEDIVTSINGGNKQLLVCGTSTIANPNKVIASAQITDHPTEVTVGGSVAKSAVKVTVSHADQSTADGVVTGVTVDTSTAGTATADVTVAGYSTVLHFDITVKAADPIPQGSITVEFSITTYCGDNNVSSGTKVSSIALDSNVTAAASGTDGNTGKMYKSDSNVWEWRFYKSGTGTLTISVGSSYVLDSVTLGAASSNYGSPVDTSVTIANNAAAYNPGANFNVKTIVVVYHAA